MDTRGSNHRSCTRTSESRFHLVFGDTLRFRTNAIPPKRVPHAVSPLRIIHQRSPRLGDTQLRVGHSAVGLRRRRTRSITGLNGAREPRTVGFPSRNPYFSKRPPRNL